MHHLLEAPSSLPWLLLTCAPQHETSCHRSMAERRAALQPREGCARAFSPVLPSC
jgi:hypothetical protein